MMVSPMIQNIILAAGLTLALAGWVMFFIGWWRMRK
jgi:hypothetical protein